MSLNAIEMQKRRQYLSLLNAKNKKAAFIKRLKKTSLLTK
jgi:hypothetical protein